MARPVADTRNEDTFDYDEEAQPLLVKQRIQDCGNSPGKGAPIDLRNWMSKIDDRVPVSAITIPGTHDSAARGSLLPFVTTQNLTIGEQLGAGIRYFDLRVGLIDDELQMVHGRSTLGQSLDSVLESMYSFLDEHPTEGLIAQIKRDRPDVNSNRCFSHAVRAKIGSRPERWRTLPSTPTMKRLRGRIQLFRRYTVNCASNLRPQSRICVGNGEVSVDVCAQGIDVSNWQNNPSTPFMITTPYGTELVVQDHYTTEDPTSFPTLIDRKGGDISYMLNLAAKTHAPPPLAGLASTAVSSTPNLPFVSKTKGCRVRERWFLNFTSAFEINLLFQYTPDQIALGTRWGLRGQWYVGINARLLAYLESQSDKIARRVRQIQRLQRRTELSNATAMLDEKRLSIGNETTISEIQALMSNRGPAPRREVNTGDNYEARHNCNDRNGQGDRIDDDDDDDNDTDGPQAHVQGIPYGVIIMDFPDKTPGVSGRHALLNAIVRTNFLFHRPDDTDGYGPGDDDNDGNNYSRGATVPITPSRRMKRWAREHATIALFVFLCFVYLAASGLADHVKSCTGRSVTRIGGILSFR